MARPAQCHLFGARRPDAPGHPGAAGARRDVGDGAGRALRHEPAGHLQAPQGAGAGRADRARARGAMASLPHRAGRPAGGRRLARDLSPALERAPGSPGRYLQELQAKEARKSGTKHRREEAWPKEVASTSRRTRGDHRHARPRCAARAGVRDVDRSEAPVAVVGAERLHHHDQRLRHATGRRVALRHARARRPRLSEPHYLRRHREAGAHRLSPRRRRRRRAGAVPHHRHLRGPGRQDQADHARAVPVGRRARPGDPRVRRRHRARADAGPSRRLSGQAG